MLLSLVSAASDQRSSHEPNDEDGPRDPKQRGKFLKTLRDRTDAPVELVGRLTSADSKPPRGESKPHCLYLFLFARHQRISDVYPHAFGAMIPNVWTSISGKSILHTRARASLVLDLAPIVEGLLDLGRPYRAGEAPFLLP